MEKRKMVSLNKRWKEFLYAGSTFGPNILMVLLTAYFTDSMNPAGLTADIENWSLSGYALVTPALFGVLWMVGKVFDGLVDIPLASFTDNLRTRWGRRRPAYIIAFIPMAISYLLAWTPLQWKENSVVNTIWVTVMLLIFFAAYTLTVMTFYGSLSSICKDEDQRIRVGNFKSFFETIGYCIVYALIPVFIGKGINIRTLVICASPLLITVLIPLFIIKEGDKYGEGREYLKEARVSLGTSLKMTLKNKLFLYWLIPNSCAFFGLNMFLSAQNTLISGVMNLDASIAAIMNTCAFAPVPIMLFIYYKLIKKKGIRFSYQVCMICFAVAILNFCVGSEYLFPHSPTTRIIIGCVGSVIGSFAIGAFFSTPYMIPSQIAAMEYKITGKDHAGMYYAMQTLTTSIVSAVSMGLVYEYIKNICTPKVIDGVKVVDETWKVGVSLVPAIVSIVCIIGFFACFKMPRNYTEEVVRDCIDESKKQ
ncbi:MAG: MFS transporter [Ruminococcaceae bacterium]|nr:MFS transporter [Oscillospiraceae bacterium]